MMFCENFSIFCPLDATGGSDRRQSRGLGFRPRLCIVVLLLPRAFA